MQLDYQGVSSTPLYLTVSVVVQEASWMRFCQVKVPMEDVAQGRILDSLDKHMRRAAGVSGDELDVTDPLF